MVKGSDMRSFVFVLMAVLGALIFTIVTLYFLFVLVFSTTDFYISMDNIGYFFVFSFVLTLTIAAVFYYFAVERQVGSWKIGRG